MKTGNTPVMAPTTNWYGIEPWLAPEDEKLRHDASRECFHSAANVVVDSTWWRSAGRQRAQRAERRSDLAESRQWNFLQLLAELRAHIFQLRGSSRSTAACSSSISSLSDRLSSPANVDKVAARSRESTWQKNLNQDTHTHKTRKDL